MSRIVMVDNGGRRLGDERRQFSYTHYLPERRLVEDRRCGLDRRKTRYHRELNKSPKKIIELLTMKFSKFATASCT